ncbi:MAG: LamG domain-containing protein [Phycisphaerales bacterium]|nr:LamG domain-containing protein [Phycisphaerales bacterium]
MSGAGRHGTAENATAYDAEVVLGRRKVVGLDFGAHGNARVNCGVHAAINNTGSFTLEAWARAKVTPVSIVDIVGANYGSNPFGLGLRMVTAPLRLNLLTGGASALTSSGFTPPVGSWVHYAGTWNESSGQAAIYVNGTLHASGILSKPRPKTSGQAFCIGNWTSTSRNWKGQIALAAVYGVALSLHDIALRYQLGVQGL